MSRRLESALKWWADVLKEKIAHTITLKATNTRTHIFTDAATNPPVLAAVMLCENGIKYTVLKIGKDQVNSFCKRCNAI